MEKKDEYIAIYSRKSRFTGKGESIGIRWNFVKHIFADTMGKLRLITPLFMKMKAFQAGI